jgi:hypothetical protein
MDTDPGTPVVTPMLETDPVRSKQTIETRRAQSGASRDTVALGETR